jgi:hypothetical protein
MKAFLRLHCGDFVEFIGKGDQKRMVVLDGVTR